MSELIVPVVKIESIKEHPNADSLEICDILGYQLCVPKGEMHVGEICVYFPVDTLIPGEWAEKFGVSKFLKGKNRDRVGCIRLRGEPSFGLVVKVPEGENWQVGDNVANYYGALKYEPPVKFIGEDMAGYEKDIDPYFINYTEIGNGRIYQSIFQEGEPVIVTEKIHGTNSRVGLIRCNVVVGSHTIRKKPCENMSTSLYWSPYILEGVRKLTRHFNFLDFILFGEIYGGSVQSLNYGIEKGKGLGYMAFDLFVGGKYMEYDEFTELCREFGVPMVPLLYRGPFSSKEIEGLAEGTSSVLGANHTREGVVVRPEKERSDANIGRVILKWVGIDYQLSKHKEQDVEIV